MQAPQPMDIDPIDDGPRSLSSPNGSSSDRSNNFQVITLPVTISKEEDARKAIDMLRSEDSTARVSAAHRLDSIASVLGPERTRHELLPFVTDGVDDEDEVLLALASSLGRMVTQVGGPTQAHTLLRPLELLLTVEETLVRETATSSVQSIADQLPPQYFQHDYADMLRRLALQEWFTARISSACLIATAHTRLVDPEQRKEHVDLFVRLCNDDTPMVRRVAARHLGSMLQAVVVADGRDVLKPGGIAVEKLVPLYETFAAADQPDSVRLQTAENCVAFGIIISSLSRQQGRREPLRDNEIALLQRILPLIVATIDDRSWRVRWTAAAKFAAVITAYDDLPDVTDVMDTLIPAYEKLLQDPEAEVRTAAALNLADVARCKARVPMGNATTLNRASDSSNEDTSGPRVTVAERLVKRLTSLTEDDSEHVRAAVAMVATGLAPVLGRDATIMHLVPPVLLMIRDAASEVRLNLISSLAALNEVIGVDLLSQSLLPAILDLAQDGKWRIRLAIIENIPLLAGQLGKEFFTERLAGLCVDWLGDDIATIRKAAAKNLEELTALFGTKWALEHLVPPIQEFLGSELYLRRLTALQAISLMATKMSQDTARNEILPTILDMALDRVANIRFTVARELERISPHCGVSTYESQIVPVLTVLMDDEDRDVRFYAESTATSLEELLAQSESS
ncbi:serine/threonine-protein phosphatase 2A regulatory subunit A [Fistulifera solaris]|uniref:Serine/threonine-protein phosphatase 2A regulatory subunit A n=1 Tax=Fistulifera solaris TaxID=1519565 RepID=A0A1Z5K4X6_FISSO|nr:serine/threonine-protein phosphatase 2A regulatory subunit A [Fistulifera solaris]|eukprot:GAX21279.1 serine/threonine-protein phosphatase 2A regulatory subunit A [Fistulifera solaris]